MRVSQVSEVRRTFLAGPSRAARGGTKSVAAIFTRAGGSAPARSRLRQTTQIRMPLNAADMSIVEMEIFDRRRAVLCRDSGAVCYCVSEIVESFCGEQSLAIGYLQLKAASLVAGDRMTDLDQQPKDLRAMVNHDNILSMCQRRDPRC